MLADKDKQIEGLNRRLVAVDEERRTHLAAVDGTSH
jgi:hypothetical protein